jgi:hypothetical protein
MAADRITIQRDQSAAIESAELLSFIRAVRDVYELGTRIRAKMQHAFTGNANAALINWAALQTLWGIPTNGTDAGDASNGKIVYTFVDGAVGSMEGVFQTSAAKDITERVG